MIRIRSVNRGRKIQALLPLLLSWVVPPETVAQTSAPTPVFGFYNVKTHSFVPATQPAASPAPGIVRKGTLTLHVDIKAIGVPAAGQLTAYATAYLEQTNFQNSIANTAPMKRAGSDAAVTFTFPFIFTAQTLSDKISVRVQVSSSALPYPSTVLIQEIPLPAEGANTVISLAGAI